MACTFDLSCWQVTLGVVTATIALMNLIVSTSNYWLSRRVSRVPEERRKMLLRLISERISASSREIESVAERAKALAVQIRLNVLGRALDEVIKLSLSSLALPGAENFLEFQKELRLVARGEDFQILRFFEAVRTYQEVLVRLEAAARERRHSEFSVLAEALSSAAAGISNRPRCQGSPSPRSASWQRQRRKRISVGRHAPSLARRRWPRKTRDVIDHLERSLYSIESCGQVA